MRAHFVQSLGSGKELNTTYDGSRHRIHLFRWVIVGLLALLVVGSLAFWGIALATGHAPFFFYRPFGFFFFPFGFLFFFIFVFFIIRLAFWGSWWGWRGHYHGYYWGDAKEVLRQRYARGEIMKEQFDQMMRDLDEHK